VAIREEVKQETLQDNPQLTDAVLDKLAAGSLPSLQAPMGSCSWPADRATCVTPCANTTGKPHTIPDL